MLIVDPGDFKTILSWNKRNIFIQGHCISTQQSETSTKDLYKALSPEHVQSYTPELSELDKVMLEGDCNGKSRYTKAHELAMRIIIRTASIMKDPSLISVCQAHVDGAHFGPASVFFGKRLRDLGGKFTVPTTVNAISTSSIRILIPPHCRDIASRSCEGADDTLATPRRTTLRRRPRRETWTRRSATP